VLVTQPAFAPAVRKPCEVLSVKEIRKSIPAFASPELEQHLQKFPSTQVRYCGWQLEAYHYIALDSFDYYFELGKNGWAPIDPVLKKYIRHEAVHLNDCLNNNVVCRRFFESSGLLQVTNIGIPAWGCLHSTREVGCLRFFKFCGEVEFIHLDASWTRTVAPFVFQFSSGSKEIVPFSKRSIVRLVIEHNSRSDQWRVHGSVFRRLFSEGDEIADEIPPEQRMCEEEKKEWEMPVPSFIPIKITEMNSAAKIDNCKRYFPVQEIERSMFERREQSQATEQDPLM
jgi:hypothetical protein